MRAVWRVTFGGLRGQLRSAALVAIVVALAAAGLSAALVVRGDAAARLDAAFVADRGPDLVVTVATEQADAVARALRADPSVSEVAAPRRIVDVRAALNGAGTTLTLNELNRPNQQPERAINAPVLTAGRLPASSSEVAIDAGVAREEGVSVGDSVVVRSDESALTLHVVGLAYDFTDCFYPTCDPGRAWALGDVVAAFGGGAQTLIAVDVADGADPNAVARAVDVANPGAVSGWNTWPDTRQDMLVETKYFGAFLAAFGLFVLIASVVVIAGSVTARALARERALAHYRTVGFTRGQTTASVVIEQLLVGLVAALIGNVVAGLIAPRLAVGSLQVLGGQRTSFSTVGTPASVGITMVVVLLATLPPAVRAGRRPLREGLNGVPTAAPRLSRVAERLVFGRRPIAAALGVRSAFTRPVRTLLSVLAVALAITVAMVASGFGRTMDEMLAHPELGGNPQAATLQVPPGMSTTQVEERLATLPEVAGWFSVIDDIATVGDRSVHIRAIGGDPAAATYVVGSGRPLTAAGQLLAGYRLFTDMGWTIGERVHLLIGDRSLDVKVVGWYRETEDSGDILQIRTDDYELITPGADPQFSVVARSGITRPQVGAALVKAFGDNAEVVVESSDGGQLRPFRLAMATMTGLIGLVAVAHLASTTVIAARERTLRTGVLRALGMTRTNLVTETLGRVAIVAAVATLIGLPLGWLANRALGDMLTSAIGAGPGISVGTPPMHTFVIAAVAVTIAAVTAIASTAPALRRPSAAVMRQPT